ncbi:MAG: YnfA family protein [Verrucomicrobiota bacterium]|nr:YnfA family protein [Verrucomicrobiota bacterium]
MRVFWLYALTALAEIVGCYSVYLWLRLGRSAWWLAPGAVALGVFAWLLTFHPAASGRVYAAYGGVYIAAAILWLWLIDGVRPSRWDLIGSAICVAGAMVIYFAPRS